MSILTNYRMLKEKEKEVEEKAALGDKVKNLAKEKFIAKKAIYEVTPEIAATSQALLLDELSTNYDSNGLSALKYNTEL